MTQLRIPIGDGQVSALLTEAVRPFAILVLAHGAGAGMTHPFTASVAEGLAGRGISTLRFQFPFMEAGSKRPDRPALAQETIRAAVSTAGQLAQGLPVFAGGKSFGGRMTSLAQAAEPLPGVRGLVFLGFPLHPAGKPSMERWRHLADVQLPMLFVQGTRDALADLGLLRGVLAELPTATLAVIPEADHSFHVPARSRASGRDVMDEVLSATQDWMRSLLTGSEDE